MDFHTRRYYYNRCDLNESLAPRDERNVDLDAMDSGTGRPRGVVWVERLADRVLLSDKPTCTLFTGLPGSGKSTELRRLKERLSSADVNMLSVLIDAEEFLDVSSPIDIPDIIAIVVHATEKEVLRAEGSNPDQAKAEGYLDRLWNWLTRTDVELKEAKVSLPHASLVMEMKTRETFRARVRRAVSTHLTEFLDEASRELKDLQTRARALGYSELLIIVDSLEKLRGMSSNWHEVLHSAEYVFGSGAPYLSLPVHVIYTVPVALVGRSFTDIEFMPMIKIRERNGARFEPGIAAMRELIRRRIPDDAMASLLGSPCDARIDELITQSGGYPREIMRYLRAVLANKEFPLSEDSFERIVNETRDAYRRIVSASAFTWLARLARDKYLTIENEEHRAAADLVLTNNVVMRYLNHRDWFDLHPAVLDIPGIRDALRALDEPRSRPGNE